MIPRTLLLLATLLVGAACQDESASDATPQQAGTTATTGSSVAAPGAPVAGPAPARMTELADGVRLFGEGRATLAAYDPAADRTVVATTIGVVAQAGDGEPVTLVPERATLLALSPDGAHAGVVTAGGTLGIWDLTTGRPAATFPISDSFGELTFAGPDLVLAAGETEVAWFAAPGSSGTAVSADAASALGPLAIDDSGTVYVPIIGPAPQVATWTPTGGRRDLDVGLAPGSRLTGVMPSADGTHVAVLAAPPDAGDALAVWDVRARRVVAQVPLPNFVTPGQVAFPVPDRVVLPNLDRVVAYDLSGEEVAAFPTGPSAVSEIHGAGGAVVVSRLDGTLTRWVPGEDPHELGTRTVALVDQRGGAATTVVDQVGLVRTFGSDGAPLHHLDRWAVGQATAVDLTADAGTLAIATSTGAVRIIDVASGSDERALDRSQGGVFDVSLAPDERLLATGVSVQKRTEAWDDTVEATDLGSDARAFALGGEAEDVSGCASFVARVVFSPDGALLASTSHDFTVQVTPVADPDATAVLEPHLGTVLDLAFSPDGSRLVTSADDGTMRTWDTADWTLVSELDASAGGWTSIAFSPDGSQLAVSDLSGRLSLLDPATGEVRRTFSDSRTALGEMVFTPDGSTLLAPQPDGAVGAWDVASGAVVRQLVGHTLPVAGIAVSDDGRAAATASQDGTVRYWPLV